MPTFFQGLDSKTTQLNQKHLSSKSHCSTFNSCCLSVVLLLDSHVFCLNKSVLLNVLCVWILFQNASSHSCFRCLSRKQQFFKETTVTIAPAKKGRARKERRYVYRLLRKKILSKNQIRICLNTGHTLGEFTRTRHRTEPTTVLRLLCCHLQRENARDHFLRKKKSNKSTMPVHNLCQWSYGKRARLVICRTDLFLMLFVN